jgi:hypothetical protein
VIAERLVRAGMACTRFDYYATGDSDGDDGDASLESCVGSTLEAAAHLHATAHVNDVAVAGLRLGATIATLAARRMTAMPTLILWDPIVDGAGYLRELHDAQIAESRTEYDARWDLEPPLREQLTARARNEPLGFALNDAMRAEISAITPAALSFESDAPVHVLDEVRIGTAGADWNGVWPGAHVQRVSSGVRWASNEALNTSLVPTESVRALLHAAGMPFTSRKNAGSR